MRVSDGPARCRRVRAGFTLLEVLAAVAVLGLLYTALAGLAIQGLRAEGEASRRLEASLLADQELADLEAEIEAGGVPPIGREESDEEDYRVVVEVLAYELPIPQPEPGSEQEAEGSAAGASLLAAGTGGQAPLRRIDVHVGWREGGADRAVTRTTFAFDPNGVSSLRFDATSEPTS